MTLDKKSQKLLDKCREMADKPEVMGACQVMLETFEEVRSTFIAQGRRLMKEAAQKKYLERELALARELQQTMLPKDFPNLPWARAYGKISQCHEVCGDLFDVLTQIVHYKSFLKRIFCLVSF